MDFSKYQEAFEKMEYDGRTSLKVILPNTKSTIIVTESADIESASDFISRCFQSEDLYQIRSIIVQGSVEKKFIELLKSKLKCFNTQSLNDEKISLLKSKLALYNAKGLEVIHQCEGDDPGVRSAIVKCPRNLIDDDDNLPIVSLEVFRTSKEGISFAKSSLSIGLWCENISISFEFINSLPNARQIWLNASHGVVHPNIPFFNGKIVCDDPEIREKSSDFTGSTVQVSNNVQFVTTFRANTFQTVVIPFGETFAN